jgi:hypothetical protein
MAEIDNAWPFDVGFLPFQLIDLDAERPHMIKRGSPTAALIESIADSQVLASSKRVTDQHLASDRVTRSPPALSLIEESWHAINA